MMLELTLYKVLIYYDEPQLFLAKNTVGTTHVCMLVDNSSEQNSYIATPVSQQVLRLLITGKIDLRTIFINLEFNNWFVFNIDVDNKIFAEPLTSKIPENFLPEEGLYLDSIEIENELIVSEVLERDRTIIHFAMSDYSDHPTIAAETLGEFLKLYQSLIKFTYKKLVSSFDATTKKLYDQPQNYVLNAFGSSKGSFNMHFQTLGQKDLFGNSKIELALNKIQEITEENDNEEELIELFKTMKGLSIQSYQKFLEAIIKNKIEIKYKWFSPGIKEVQDRKIDVAKATKIYKILTSKEDLSIEEKEFIGVIRQADIGRGNWRILNKEDNKEYAGKAPTELLKGLVLDTEIYLFVCQETIEEEKVSEKEIINYFLVKVEKLV